MNKEQEQIIDEVYENFEKWYNEHSGKEDYTGYYVPTKEEFIRLIKTDSEFSEKLGLKIEERELRYEERIKLYEEKTNLSTTYILSVKETLDKHNVPTKLITLTNNNEKIETYE